ncbi:Fe(2+) transporter permease subunit FeoB [Halochromatium salexigens]|uniref:Ferrous iron transport protein B n=1 Tax=Halochromatium salexigens TaxID=49447 RepID=A0AAJ0XGL7_HALSE|nr:Fe(2+) transporter permease subunit FeoB [Halochromatium salexigens]MBK5930930.1 ferrous iron transport protein B [Halochromatium salexigens]
MNHTPDQPNRSTPSKAPLILALAGNPNCGKSALFNALTGIRQTTGNWPGVTVERREGRSELDGRPVRVIDLPGIYALDADSLDEQVTRDYLLSREADLVINVADASNLERNLYLTIQLLELDVPVVLALNMMDVARKRGIAFDTDTLAEKLGCPVVPVVAVSKEGITELSARALAVADGREPGGHALGHDESVEQAIAELAPRLSGESERNQRWRALKLIETGPEAQTKEAAGLEERIQRWRRAIAARSGEDADIQIADTRFAHAHALAKTVQRQRGGTGSHLSDAIDRVVLSRLWGIPLFLAMMYLMFVFTINIGGAFIDLFDGVASALFVDGLGALLSQLGAPDWLRLILADGVGAGLTVVATFIPIIASLYIFLSALEDSGYMARAAFVMDRFMRSIGLPGKAFVPLIVGFGCNVPAVMATRTLENERERKLAILMNPFMSCGARLPVYVLFAAAFFPHSGQNVVFALYLTGIAIALLTGLVMKRTLLAGTSTGFMMELPPYHMPRLRGVLLRTWDRVKLFLREAGKIIIIMVVILNLLSSIGTDGRLDQTDSDESILAATSRLATPLFAPMGIGQDNWPAVLGIFSGVLAKEVIVGTLDSLYSRLALEAAPAEEDQRFRLGPALGAALATVPANLSEVGRSIADPLGVGIGAEVDPEAIAAEQALTPGTFGAMEARFDGRAGAFAYLLFVLLYFPCVATLGAIVREAGAPWASFVAAWTTGIAYISATLFYQTLTFERHPLASGIWIGALLVLLILVFTGLRLWGQRGRTRPLATAREHA